uniref:Uncharacterized protein n=1 Tax=Anguilla anguilla TaxID=7936 RepID=A0A0E9PZ34_ANGAN
MLCKYLGHSSQKKWYCTSFLNLHHQYKPIFSNM